MPMHGRECRARLCVECRDPCPGARGTWTLGAPEIACSPLQPGLSASRLTSCTANCPATGSVEVHHATAGTASFAISRAAARELTGSTIINNGLNLNARPRARREPPGLAGCVQQSGPPRPSSTSNAGRCVSTSEHRVTLLGTGVRRGSPRCGSAVECGHGLLESTRNHPPCHRARCALMEDFVLAFVVTLIVGGTTLLALSQRVARRARKPFPVLSNPSAKFYRDEYDDARTLFRETAAAAGAALHILPLEGECWGGMCGDPDAFKGDERLTVDVAVLPSTTNGTGPLLLHMSGVHGVEGHAGSAIQIKWLDMVAQKEVALPKGTTVVLVHLMNPYGFKHGRRCSVHRSD